MYKRQAKLQRYQDIIDYHLVPEIQSLANDLQRGQTRADIDSSLQKLSVINMLNTKYIILSANSTPIENTARSGNAWFVENYQLVDTPDEEILSLKAIDPEKTAIIGRDFAQAVAGKNIRFDSTATIQLTSYAPNKLTYKTKASQEQLAVFSEVYYLSLIHIYPSVKVICSAERNLRSMSQQSVETRNEPTLNFSFNTSTAPKWPGYLVMVSPLFSI